MRRALLLPLLLMFVACRGGGGGGAGEAEIPALPSGVRGEVYAASIAPADYEGPRRVTVVNGALPDGVEVDAAGAVTGIPTFAGRFAFTALLEDMRGYDDTVAELFIDIGLSDDDIAAGAFLAPGIEPGSLYRENAPFPLQDNVWMRVSEAGVDEHHFVPTFGLYLPGGNSRNDHGLRDDELIGAPSADQLDIVLDAWEATEETRVDVPNGYPNPHTPDGDPPVLEDDGSILAGSDTGSATLTLSSEFYPGATASYDVQIVPPDWCANGVSSGPHQGVCE